MCVLGAKVAALFVFAQFAFSHFICPAFSRTLEPVTVLAPCGSFKPDKISYKITTLLKYGQL